MNSETPQRAPSAFTFEGAYSRGLRAAAEALFPLSDSAPDHAQTDLVRRSTEYVERLPPTQRQLLKLLFVAVELCAPIFSPGLRPFSRRSEETRRKNVSSWQSSWCYPLRLLGDALKATLQMIYLSHPAVVAHIGEYKVCAVPEDTFVVDIRGTAKVPAP